MNGLISWCLLLHLRPRLSTEGPPQAPVQARALQTCRETALCRAHTAVRPEAWRTVGRTALDVDC